MCVRQSFLTLSAPSMLLSTVANNHHEVKDNAPNSVTDTALTSVSCTVPVPCLMLGVWKNEWIAQTQLHKQSRMMRLGSVYAGIRQ